MQSSVFTKNLEAIKRKNPRLYQAIQGSRTREEIRVEQSKTGLPVPLFEKNGKKIAIHSRFDPQKEAERMLKDIAMDEYHLFVVSGFGFAYHVDAIREGAGKNATILILEAYPGIVREACQARDISHIFDDPRIIMLVQPDDDSLAEAMKARSSYRTIFLTHRGSHQVDPEYYNNLQRIAKSYISVKEVNIATLAKFERTWAANIARNIGVFAWYPGIQNFYDRFPGVPAIVASAGPSLEKSIPFIKDNIDRAVIVAVDTSFHVLRRHGIEPHFCITVDPQVINARYFEGSGEGKTVVVADPTAHPSVFRLYRGRFALTGIAFEMMQWIEEYTGKRGELRYGGSVSTNAYDFAGRLGCAPVVMVGQDLAFTGGYAHARGSYLDEQVFLKTKRTYTPQMFNRSQLRALPPIEVKGIRSPVVRTNRKMMIFLNWFGKLNDENLVNATWDGARIENTVHQSHDEISFPEHHVPVWETVDDIYSSCAIHDKDAGSMQTALYECCRKMEGEIESLMEVCDKAVYHAEKLKELVGAERRDQGKMSYTLSKLDEIDRRLEKYTTLKDMVGFTIQRVIHTITEGYELDEDSNLSEHEKIAQRSLYFYRGLLDGSTFNRKMLQKMCLMLQNR